MGPAYLVSVGYMDPGNWATDIAGGSGFGYKLIWVLLLSNIMALVLQSLSARLGLVRGLDLAQASRQAYTPVVNFLLWILAEIAIVACDLAEVLGMALGLQLLCGLPLPIGVCLTVLDTFFLLFLINYGIRKMEAYIISLVVLIGLSFLVEMIFARPDMGELVKGFIPGFPESKTLAGPTALYIAIGIIGATVMPHNLYLHSSLVQSRKIERTEKEIKKAIKYNIADSAIALNLAFFVNCAILVLAASTFYKNGMFEVSDIREAHKFLQPMLGTNWAPVLFAIALICAGQSSTITGTLAGQVVMEGYLNLRIQPWIRRMLTRMLAIIPALLTILLLGEASLMKLLVLSQVILSLQLGFAVIPLIHFVSDKKKMGTFVIGIWTKITAWSFATIILLLNARLIGLTVMEWIENAGQDAWIYYITVVPVITGGAILLLYVILRPVVMKNKSILQKTPHGGALKVNFADAPSYKRIAITIDFSSMDAETISSATKQGGKDAEYLLIHIVESAGALVMNEEIRDYESASDFAELSKYEQMMHKAGYNTRAVLGYGNPKKQIPILVNEYNADLLVMGAHGHHILKDILFGTTVDGVRHRIHIPLLIIRKK